MPVNKNFRRTLPEGRYGKFIKWSSRLGSTISQAQGATSWYLDSRTFDGPTGINSQMINYFGDAVNAVANGTSAPDKALAAAAQGVAQVLANINW